MSSQDAHKFVVGQAVTDHSPRGPFEPRGTYIVTAALPKRSGEFEYQVRHPNEVYNRVARESDLRERARR
jgi:hypothetical protein